jgi:LmbE family N-acetylglucosaminyl deacetylase
VDITDACLRRRSIVVAPHPDDETLGCGGTIAAKRAAGTDVLVVIATDGRLSHRSSSIGPDELARIRLEESRRACSVLGVPDENVVSLGIAEGELDDARLEPLLRDLIDRFQPDELLVPAAIDAHADHRVVNQHVRAAAAHLRSVVVLEYPVWMWTPSAWWDDGDGPARRASKLVLGPIRATKTLHPQVVDVTRTLALKRAALDEYRSQMTALSGEEDWATMERAFLDHFTGPSELFFSP